jgi:hypothetical protein
MMAICSSETSALLTTVTFGHIPEGNVHKCEWYNLYWIS